MPFVTWDLADIRTPTRHLESALTSHWSRTHRALTKRPQSHDWVVNSQAGLHPWAWHKQPTRSYKQDKVAITFHANIKLATVCFVPVLTALCELPAAISNAKESKARLLFRWKRQLKNNRKSLQRNFYNRIYMSVSQEYQQKSLNVNFNITRPTSNFCVRTK